MRKLRFKDYLLDYLEFYHISNKDFANRIGISEKHLIDILSGNCDLSSSVIASISLVTNIPIEYIYNVEASYKLEVQIDSYLKEHHLTKKAYLAKFHYRDLMKEKYIDFKDREDSMELIKDILKFLRVSSPEKVYEINSQAHYKSRNDKPELLLLWLEKCYRETLKQTVSEYHKENISQLVDYILKCAHKNEFDEQALIRKFNQNGIYLVIQKDLPGSKISGAFRVHRNIPAIYLTYKHQRIADIYFALLHEVAHLKSDFNKAKATSLVTYEDDHEEIERKRDQQAFNWMVDDHYYTEVCCKKDYDISLENHYHKSFIVYRLAHDGYLKYRSKTYQMFNPKITIKQ